jgi:hypothetical protein
LLTVYGLDTAAVVKQRLYCAGLKLVAEARGWIAEQEAVDILPAA